MLNEFFHHKFGSLILNERQPKKDQFSFSLIFKTLLSQKSKISILCLLIGIQQIIRSFFLLPLKSFSKAFKSPIKGFRKLSFQLQAKSTLSIKIMQLISFKLHFSFIGFFFIKNLVFIHIGLDLCSQTNEDTQVNL